MGLDPKHFVLHNHACQRVPTLKKMLNNECGKIIQPVDTNQPLSLTIPVPAQWACERYSHGSKNENLNGPYSMAPSHQR